MKTNKLKIITIIALIILVTMVSFAGVYVQVQNRMENKVKDYSYAMDLKGTRTVTLKIATGNKTVVKDSSGKTVSNSSSLTDQEIQEKGYTKEEIPYNTDDQLTTENYEATKQIFEKRLKALGVEDYIIRLEENTGNMVLEIPENDKTDTIVSNITTVGKYQIIDADTQSVLMDNSDIKTVNVLYGSASSSSLKSSGTNVYLNIEFNKDGAQKLEDISGTYVNTTATNSTDNTSTNETNTTSDSSSTAKKITMKIDDEEIMSTSFDEVIRTGKLQLTIGKASTDKTDLKDNYDKASNIATVLNNGNAPVKYDVDENKYILSDITKDMLNKLDIGILIAIIVALLILIIRYKSNGVLAAFAYAGLVSIFALVIRYANVVISLEGEFGIIVVLILNYIFTDKLLNNIRKEKSKETAIANLKEATKQTYGNFVLRMVPIYIMSIVFSFIQWEPISSFGMIMFWGIVLLLIYNFAITYAMLRLKIGTNDKEKIKKDNLKSKKTDKKVDKKAKEKSETKKEETKKIEESTNKKEKTKKAKEQKSKKNQK